MAGASIGIIRPKGHLTFGQNLCNGDLIIGLESSGIHSNGVSLARKVAEKLKDGYFSVLPSGKLLGEALFEPTILYTRAIIDMLDACEVHYLSPITGHCWKKIMRAKKPFSYRIDFVPEPGELFRFLVDKSGVSEKEAYFTWNMGIGYVVIVPKESRDAIFAASEGHGIKAFELGTVREGEKNVSIKPKGIVFD
jgi:phosphoribosylformylglycinamidine cyclo-ligase